MYYRNRHRKRRKVGEFTGSSNFVVDGSLKADFKQKWGERMEQEMKGAILREDGKMDLDGWEEYTKENGWNTISEFKNALNEKRTLLEKMFLENAIQKRSNDISLEIVKNFIAEGLTVSESLSLFETVKEKILKTKINR